MYDSTLIDKRLRELGKSRRWLARKTGLTASYVARIAGGKASSCFPDALGLMLIWSVLDAQPRASSR